MPGFVADSVVQAALLDQLQKTNTGHTAALEPWWPGIVTRANVWAYGEIRRRLAARGYTPVQVLAWDDGIEFQTDLAVWKCLSSAQAMAPESYSAKGLESLDRRHELTGGKDGIGPAGVTVGGIWQDPAGPVGQAVTGPMSGVNDLLGTPIDPEDPRIGEVVEI